MTLSRKRFIATAVGLALSAPLSAWATNGMNLEGYGPIATGMGGASMAYDNGTAGMMNNPATLGLMEEGNRLDIAVGILGPNITSTYPGALPPGTSNDADSDGTAYLMPAFGWNQKRGSLTYGVGVFAQGGMGTEYKSSTWLGGFTGQDARSEVSVGRFMVPLAYDVNDKLTIGGSLDLVWGGMDIKMPLPGGDLTCAAGAQPGTFADFICPNSQILGEAVVSPNLGGALGALTGAGYDTFAINFSNDSDYTGEASGTGFGAKLGLVYKISNNLSLGATYHSKTAMSDWEGDAEMVAYDTDGPNPDQPLEGKIKIKDFQWPATWGLGVAYTADRWMVAGDVKLIQWADAMKNFKMVFKPDEITGQLPPGESADITMYQDWKDQTVVQIGGGYMFTDKFVGRLGANLAANPIPDKYVNPLFPATIENHYTLGLGYMFTEHHDLNFSFAYAPEVKVTNSNTSVDIKHSQMNWQLMYSFLF